MTKRATPRRPAARRTQVLRLLRAANQPLGITEIAERLGIHANTARFHLQTLVDNGQVESMTVERGVPGRPPQLFRAARRMDPMGPRHYRVLAEILTSTLADDPDPSERATEAGRGWGRLQASADVVDSDGGDDRSVQLLIGMLDELGFAPDESDDPRRREIGLRNCPFLELAADHADVVCPVHLGLMRGAMEAWGSTVTVDRLEAFAEPDLCRVHLSAAPRRDAALRPRSSGLAGSDSEEGAEYHQCEAEQAE